jgi:DNA replication protein DnaC
MQDQNQTVPFDDLSQWEKGLCDLIAARHAGLFASPWDRRLSGSDLNDAVDRFVRSVGYRYQRSTFSGYEIYDDRQRVVVDRLIGFAREMPEKSRDAGGLILFGNPGTGKDHLFVALLRIAIVKHRLDAAWWDAGDLFDEFYFAIKGDNETRLRDLQRGLIKPHILAISDPQPPQGDLSDSQIRRLRDVIDRRYRAGLVTWITTNLDKKAEAEALLTAPVLQRIKEAGAQILCDWPSYRETRKVAW